jgi:hypothetical protein
LLVASARTRKVNVAAGALVVWVAAVAVAAWASGAVAPELSFDVTSLPDFGVSYDPALNHLIRCHQHRLPSSGRGPSSCKAAHISNDSSVMLPSSFGITRWCRRAIHIPFGDLTHHCSLPSGRIIRP